MCAVTEQPTQCRSACQSSPPPHPHHRSHPLRRPAHDHNHRHHVESHTRTICLVEHTHPIDARRPSRRLDAPTPARAGRDRPSRRRRRPAQRGRDRSRRRSRPHIPLPASRPDGENPCAASRSSPGDHIGPAVTRASLQADLLAAHERAARLNARIHQLEKRLSEALGEHTWRESGLGAPADIDALHQRISQLEQQTSTYSNNSTNATKTSPQPAPPTANSWPDSTRQPGRDDTRESACTTPVAADSISRISF